MYQLWINDDNEIHVLKKNSYDSLCGLVSSKDENLDIFKNSIIDRSILETLLLKYRVDYKICERCGGTSFFKETKL